MACTRQRWIASLLILSILFLVHLQFADHLHTAKFRQIAASVHVPRRPNYAFATLLAPKHPGEPELELQDTERDVYFESVHVMTYQLLHSPSARRSSSSSSSMSSSSSSMSSSKKIDFVVLVTNEVTAPKKARLEKDGATVVVVDRLISEWMTPKTGRWQDCLTKLRLLKMTQYGKITFIDVDHLITQSLDGVFDDPAAAVQHTVVNASVVAEAPLPDTYVFAARPEAAGGYGHVNPPPEGNYFNAGFFVLKPDERMLEYYEELMLPKHEGLFPTTFVE